MLQSRNVEQRPYSLDALKKIRSKVTVFLRRDPSKTHLFHCPNCQNPIFKYQGEVVALIAGDANDNLDNEQVVKFPIIIICKNTSQKWGPCDATYVFEGWAT